MWSPRANEKRAKEREQATVGAASLTEKRRAVSPPPQVRQTKGGCHVKSPTQNASRDEWLHPTGAFDGKISGGTFSKGPERFPASSSSAQRTGSAKSPVPAPVRPAADGSTGQMVFAKKLPQARRASPPPANRRGRDIRR